MKEKILTVVSNTEIAPAVYELKLSGAEDVPQVGQFVELAVEGFYLRRPFGVADYEDGVLTILYRVQGNGTEAMTLLKCGDKVNVLLYLGNGFTADKFTTPLIIGGGMGVAPLYYLTKRLKENGYNPTVILGFKNKSEIIYADKFEKLGKVYIATDDGSCGFHGNALDRLKVGDLAFDGYFACGPAVMLKYLQAYSTAGELSLEARMGCGFGACMGCSIMTTAGAKRVCKEGPVFNAAEVIF